MKTKQMKFLTVSILALSLGFTGCSNDGEDPIVPSVPETGSLMISFKASELSTRSVSKNATEAEKTLKKVHAFIYKSNGTLEKVAEFASTDFDQDNDSYKLKDGNKIDGLEAGNKTVLLGINLPDTLATKIQSAASAGKTSSYSAEVDHLTDVANGYVMFSDVKTAMVEAGTTSSPSGTFYVDRIVAKTSVKKKSGVSMSVAGGTITSINYDVQNINKVIYPVAPSEYDKTTIDHEIPESFKEVENMPDADNTPDLLPTYMTEYKPVLSLTDDSYPTYVRIRCAFSPSKHIVDANGTVVENGYTTGSTFWALPLADGTVAYFIDELIAKAYFGNAANSSLIANFDPDGYDDLVADYPGGNVDYGVFLHKTANTFDVVRNSYYIITITGINGLGESSETPQIDPKGKGSLVSFELTINEWEGVESDDEQIS